MLAVPYRDELRTQAARGAAAIGLIAAAAVALYVVAGRFDLNLDVVDAALIAVGALVAAVIYSRRGERLGLLVGGIGLLIDFELDVLALVLPIGLGGVAGADLFNAWTLARYERSHRGTVYRIEDPPGTEAGLGWAPA